MQHGRNGASSCKVQENRVGLGKRDLSMIHLSAFLVLSGLPSDQLWSEYPAENTAMPTFTHSISLSLSITLCGVSCNLLIFKSRTWGPERSDHLRKITLTEFHDEKWRLVLLRDLSPASSVWALIINHIVWVYYLKLFKSFWPTAGITIQELASLYLCWRRA